MSHFSLAVFTATQPEEAELSRILAPFEEANGNPNSKWDWWCIGGRWHGELIVKPETTDTIIGEPGILGEKAPANAVDGARMGDIDFFAMLDKVREERGRTWDRLRQEQKQGAKIYPWTIDASHIPRDLFVQAAKLFTPFAFILDGKWHEKGEMVFFGEVKNEMPEHQWELLVARTLQERSEDDWITIIDCHI